MPAVANILALDLRSNPPQQQQRDNNDDSFSSLLPAKPDDNQNDASQSSRCDEARPGKPERPSHSREERGRENVHSAKRNHAKPDVQESGKKDISAEETISSDDAVTFEPAETNKPQVSADAPAESVVSVPALATPVVEADIQIAAALNLTLTVAITTPAIQSDTNPNQTAPIQNADPVAAANVMPAIALAAIVENASAGTSAGGTSIEATPIAAAVASVEIGTVAGNTAVGSTPTAQTDRTTSEAAGISTKTIPALQVAATVAVVAGATKTSVEVVDARPGQNELSDASPIDHAAATPTISETSAAGDLKTPVAPKSATPVKTAQVASNVMAQDNMTKSQATLSSINSPDPDAKKIVASAASHLAVKASEESLVDFTANTLKFDPVLVRYMPPVNAAAVVSAPTTLNPASTQFFAHTVGTTDQPVTATSAAIAVAIAARAKDGSRQFEIRLDPPELGRIDVRLDVNKSGEVSTRLTADRQDTLDLLQRDHRGLEKALESAGLKSGEDDVSFSLRQQTPDGSPNDRTQTPIAQNDVILVEDNEQTTASIDQYQWAARLRGGVDIRI